MNVIKQWNKETIAFVQFNWNTIDSRPDDLPDVA